MTAHTLLSFRRIRRPGKDPTQVSAGVAFATARESTDFLLDGQSLVESVSDDLVSRLGWGDAAAEHEIVAKLLLQREADFPASRYALLICPECGDLQCGALTCTIERDGEEIVWRDFAWENGYEEPVREGYEHLGPFRFTLAHYERALRASYGEGAT